MILLNAIATSLSDCGYEQEKINEICIKLSNIYNTYNFSFSKKSKYTPWNALRKEKALYQGPIKKIIDELTFIDYDRDYKFNHDKPKSLTKTQFIILYIQLFTFASVFMNMDKLLDEVIKIIDNHK